MSATAMKTKNPIDNLTFDWLTVLQNKAEGVAAYDQYIKDAEAEHATECLKLLKKLREDDVRSLEEVRRHVFGMIAAAASKDQ